MTCSGIRHRLDLESGVSSSRVAQSLGFERPARPGAFAIRGEKTPPGPDRDDAFLRSHKIMARPGEKCQPVDSDAVAAIFKDFLIWTENRAAATPDHCIKSYEQSATRDKACVALHYAGGYSMPSSRWICSSETPLVSGMIRMTQRSCRTIIAA